MPRASKTVKKVAQITGQKTVNKTAKKTAKNNSKKTDRTNIKEEDKQLSKHNLNNQEPIKLFGDDNVEVEDLDENNNDLESGDEWDEDEAGYDEAGEEDEVEYDVASDVESGDECIYDDIHAKKTGLNLEDIDDDIIDDGIEEPDEIDTSSYKQIVADSERRSTPVITKYERVRLLGDRATQLALGAKPMIKGVEKIETSDREKIIAQLEFEARVIPMIIEREMPDGRFEEWRISELKFKEDMIVYGSNAFVDPKTLVINPEYLNNRVREFQSGGNIRGFTKVMPSSKFSLKKNNFDGAQNQISTTIRSVFKPDLTPLEALAGYTESVNRGKKIKNIKKTN